MCRRLGKRGWGLRPWQAILLQPVTIPPDGNMQCCPALQNSRELSTAVTQTIA